MHARTYLMLSYLCCTMISENGMGAEGAEALSLVLGRLTQLTKLSLAGEYDNFCLKAGFGSAYVLLIYLLVGT